jgi:vacuolar-type H+-ATPase subunit F/Vma7
MSDKKIHVLGYDEVVLLFGLLGIEGTIIEHNEDFLKIFKNLIKKTSVALIIIYIDMTDEILEFLTEFKINNRTPFVYLLPDIFQQDIKNQDKIFNKIHELIEEII